MEADFRGAGAAIAEDDGDFEESRATDTVAERFFQIGVAGGLDAREVDLFQDGDAVGTEGTAGVAQREGPTCGSSRELMERLIRRR